MEQKSRRQGKEPVAKNPKKVKGKTGRPPKFTELEAFQAGINKFFRACDRKKRPYTMAGLALALGLSRQGLIEYEGKPIFSDAVKKAREKVHAQVEEMLYSGKMCTGAIFSLKNNFGWKDKTEVEVTGDLAEAILAARGRMRKK